MIKPTKLSRALRCQYSVLSILLCALDVALIPGPGQTFFVLNRVGFTFLLHNLEPRTEIGLGVMADVVYGTALAVFIFTPEPTLTSAIPYLREKRTTLCLIEAGAHIIFALYGFILRQYDNRLIMRSRPKKSSSKVDLSQI